MQKKPTRFLIVSIIPRGVTEEEMFYELSELKSLVDSYKGEVVDYLLQRREVHDKGKYIGRGKVEEAVRISDEKNIDVIVLNALVKPGHLYDIKSVIRKANPAIKIWDRGDLILEIFSHHAKTAEAKLQIELAAMRHMGPRIYGMGMVLSRQTGGIGGRGIGETNTELMKRHWRSQMKKTEEKLDKLATERERQMIRRGKNGLKTLSIVGYTNAGKTSLFNVLTGKKKYVRNELFATLDSITGKVYLPEVNQEVLVSDTIGFIRNLPPRLIDAFKSTLMESIYADILIHVIDGNDEQVHQKISVVENILREMNIFEKHIIYVFNKSELLSNEQKESLQKRYEHHSPIFISVKQETGINQLLETVGKKLSSEASF